MPRDKHPTTISPEIRERRKIISRMTPDEKKAYTRKRYKESAKPKLLELIEYCQNNHKICPLPRDWNRICSHCMRYTRRCEFTKFPPFQLPLVLITWHYSSDVDKRLRLLTQIYWCYKNFGMEFMYSDIMKLKDTNWHKVNIGFPKVSIKDIKKEYARWLGVNFYNTVTDDIACSIRRAKKLELTDLDEVDNFLLDTRKVYKLNHNEFTPLYEMVLKYAIQKSVTDSNESLAETVILTLKNKTKDYPELLEYALTAARHNHQLKRVMYNFLREDIDEVKDYKGDGSTSFGWY